jgi:hypothetical protein
MNMRITIWSTLFVRGLFRFDDTRFLQLSSAAMSPPKLQNNIVAGTSQGNATINVHKLLDKTWYRYPHLRRLYGWMSVVLLVQATNGLDGSIMNGMQTLTYWNKCIDTSFPVVPLQD